MARRSALASLFALAALAFTACVGPFASDDATPTAATETTEGFATICGIELRTVASQNRATAPRECFLDSHLQGRHAEFLLVIFHSTGLDAELLVTRNGELAVHRVSQAQGATTTASTNECATLAPRADSSVFDLEVCTHMQPRSGPLAPHPITAICGFEVIGSSPSPFAVDARQCLQDAFEDGTAARFYSLSVTIEGDPILEVYSVTAPREVEMLIDNRDAFGTPGLTLERCTQLLDADPPLVWEPANCFLVRKVAR